MPLRRLTKADIVNAITKNSWTTNFRHLLPIDRFLKRQLKKPSHQVFSRKVVSAQDRVKYWNIVPGDHVRLLGDKSSAVQEVLAINRFRNRVYIRGMGKGAPDAHKGRNKNYHYARCQLFLGEYEFPPKAGETEPRNIPVFAQRLGTSAAVWNPYLHRYQWDRFAVKTTPVIPQSKDNRIRIPWPKKEPRMHAKPTSYDTTKEEVSKVTYKPPPFTPSLDGPMPRIPTEKEFLSALYNARQKGAFAGTQPPVELFLLNELANPHSRAKKMKRWQAFHASKKALLNEFIQAELKELNGRTQSVARAEAAFKWRQALEESKKSVRLARWVASGGQAKLQRKIRRKVAKEAKQSRRLTELTLKEEPNQVVPKTVSV